MLDVDCSGLFRDGTAYKSPILDHAQYWISPDVPDQLRAVLTSGVITVGSASASVSVAPDDDPPPPPAAVTLSIEDASSTEGREVVFTVTLSEAAEHEVRVWYAPGGGSRLGRRRGCAA